MYSIAALNQLAEEPAFIAAVRDITKRLILAQPALGRTLGSLLQYGPERSGCALRLLNIHEMDYSAHDTQTLQDYFETIGRVLETAD